MVVKYMSLKNFKLTCPICRISIEGDTINDVVLNLPHKEKCPGNQNHIGAGISYNSNDFEDRSVLNS